MAERFTNQVATHDFLKIVLFIKITCRTSAPCRSPPPPFPLFCMFNRGPYMITRQEGGGGPGGDFFVLNFWPLNIVAIKNMRPLKKKKFPNHAIKYPELQLRVIRPNTTFQNVRYSISRNATESFVFAYFFVWTANHTKCTPQRFIGRPFYTSYGGYFGCGSFFQWYFFYIHIVTGKSRLLFSSTSSRSNRTPRALFREKLSVLESK